VDNMLTKTEAKIVAITDEQTFFNNGQFTENELDLIDWGLNDLLQKINKNKTKNKVWRNYWKKQNYLIENLIEKIQEGS